MALTSADEGTTSPSLGLVSEDLPLVLDGARAWASSMERISLSDHVAVQTAVELLVCWQLAPAMNYLREWNVNQSGIDAATWFSIRAPSKATNLTPDVLFKYMRPHCSMIGNRDEAGQRRDAAHTSLRALVADPKFGPLLVERYLPDVVSSMDAGVPIDARYSDIASLDALVAAVLRALMFCGRVNSGVRVRPAQELQRRLGGILSSCLCHQGGVWAVLSEMLSGVPEGNVSAYIRVATLIAKAPMTISLLPGYPTVPGTNSTVAYYHLVGIQVAHLLMSCCYRVDGDGVPDVPGEENAHPNRTTLRARRGAVDDGPFQGRLKRAVVMIVHAMLTASPVVASKHVLDPLLWAISPVRNAASASIHWNEPRVAAHPADILRCIRHAHALIECAPPLLLSSKQWLRT